MEIPDLVKVKINKFWDDSYKTLNYREEPFNDDASVEFWLSKGYKGPFNGAMCDMRSAQPSWNIEFIKYFSDLGWLDIGTSYYRMDTGVILPTHKDLYIRYINLFNLKGKECKIHRAIVFLEDWCPGHYAEYAGKPFLNWSAGDCVIWRYDLEHAAANIGLESRYTLQITGHL